MTEELQLKDLELKELFIKQDFEGLIDALNQVDEADVLEMNETNWDIVKKYFDLGRKDLLLNHLNFVAYTSFLTEYAGKRDLYEENVYQVKFGLFQDIYEALQEN
jgi:hypothetical protein